MTDTKLTPFQPSKEQDDFFELSVPGKTSKDYENREFTPIDFWTDTCAGEDIKRREVLDFGEEGFLLERLLNSAECQHYIGQGEKQGFNVIDEAKISYRSSERLMFRSQELADLLWERIKRFTTDQVIEGDPHLVHIHGPETIIQGTWSPVYVNPVFRLCRYHAGGHFAPHFDGHFVISAKERSMKTLMVYLNGGLEAGTTNFVDETQQLYMDATTSKYCAEEKNILCRIQPEEGLAILFNHHRLHEGAALKTGVKYILRTDVIYKNQSADPDDSETEALRLAQEAERLEARGENMKAVEMYRKAFKLSPSLAASYGN